MNQYMVNIDLPKEVNFEFISLIPHQRALVNKMMQEGTILSYALSSDRTKLWTTVLAESEDEVITIISKFPLIEYMRFEISELMFHQSVNLALPHISLN